MTRLATILDEETTGKLDPAHRIIELSLRIVDIDSGIERDAFLHRFDPERNIDAKAFAVHGISRDELEGMPTIGVELPGIIEVLKQSSIIVAHNGGGPNYPNGFDYPFLKMEVERNGLVMPDTPWFDTMVEGTFATDLGKSPNLRELCFSLGIAYDEALAHKGDYDTAVLRDAFLAGLKYGWFQL